MLLCHDGKHLPTSTSGIGSNSAICMTDCHSRQPCRTFMWLLTTFFFSKQPCQPKHFSDKTPNGHASDNDYVNRVLKHDLFCAYVLCIPYRSHLPLQLEFHSRLSLVAVLRTNSHRLSRIDLLRPSIARCFCFLFAIADRPRSDLRCLR